MLVFRRITSFILAMLLVLGLLPPVGAGAAEPESGETPETIATATEAPEAAEVPETTATATETPETTQAAVEEPEAEPTRPEQEIPAETAPEIPETEPEEVFAGETVTEEVFYSEAAETDSEALFEGYLNQLFFGNSSVSLMGTLARDTLSEADQYLYDQLKPVLLLIASGQRASTKVTVDFSESGFNSGDTDLNTVVDALVHDCPYELYWYDGCMWSYRGQTLIVWFQPCKNYQAANFDEFDPYINTTKASRAVTAADNARAIVAEYHSYSDYDKLAAYADKICALVKYNYSAANNNTWKTNINPWTLLNVFDGDSSTNVVCEGYAEGFQYLCDQSVFDGKVECYSPCGAGHKWNIVRFNGVSYLMDVTYCDTGKTAERGDHFLGGGTGSVESGYVIGGFHYWYYDETKALWGTGENSILKLSPTPFDPNAIPEPTEITQEKFEALLENCGGAYCLTKEVTLCSDLTLSGVALTVAAGGKITVPAGVKLTVSEDASLTFEEGGEVTVAADASFLALGPVAGSGLTGDGKVLLTDYESETGHLTISGRGTVADGDLDSRKDAKGLLIQPGITAIGEGAFDGFAALQEVTLPEGITAIGSRAFSGCTDLKEIYFYGDAPAFGDAVFQGVTATCHYPNGNETWTEEVCHSFGEGITCQADCLNGHTAEIIPGIPPTCVDAGIADGAYCTVCGEILAERTLLLPTGIHTYSGDDDTTCDVCGAVRVFEEEFPFSDYEWEVLKLTNKKRAAAGVAPLTGFSKIQQACDIRAKEVASYFSHSRPDGSSCFTVLEEMGITYRYAGENIASGYKTPAAVVDGWMNSPGHRENMLNPNFGHMGVGEYNKNWVQLFVSSASYASIRLLEGDRLTLDPGTNLEKLDLVGVLEGQWGMCYLPIFADYCEGYDPDALGDQTVTLSALGVSTTFTVHVHDWTEATCTSPKSCRSCGETGGEALGHKFEQVETKPTCTEDGSITGTCTRCGEAVTEPGQPALGHDPVVDKAVPPSCTEVGLTEGAHCDRCGEILEPQTEIDALGHTIVNDKGYEPTCIQTGLSDGAHCSFCGKILTAQEILPAIGHDFASGFCRNCGGEDRADYILYSGKGMTLKALHPDTGLPMSSKQVSWSLSEAFEPFAAVSKTGRLTAKKVFERVRVEAVATLVASGAATTYLVDIYPAVTQVEIVCNEKTVNGKTVLMDVSESVMTLRAQAYPLDTLAEVTWTVSDKKGQYAAYEIAGDSLTITNPTGKAGTVTIKATVNAGVKKNVTVKVNFGSFAKEIEIAEPEMTTLRGGEKMTLSATITVPETVTKPGIVWTTSDKNAATVSNGKVTAKNVAHPTLVTITATSKDGQASASIQLKIVPKNEGQLVLMQDGAYATNSTHAMNVGETYQVVASRIENGAPISETATWSTSKATVATVENGLITAVGVGTAKITAECNGMKATINIKVGTLVESLEITTKDGKNLIEENGEKVVLVSSGKGVNLVANVNTGANKAVSWSITEGAEYAKIASSGKLTANKDLTSVQYVVVKATAKDGSGANATIRVKVVPLATGVQIYQNGTRVRSNTVFVVDMLTTPVVKLNAKVFPAKANQAVEFTSSNKKTADFVNGELVCYKPGTVTITAKALDGSNAKTTFKLTIVKKVQSLTLKDGANLTVTGGKSLKLAPMVEISPLDATNKKLTWSVAPNDYGIKISSSGVLSTKKVKQPVTVNVMVTTQDGSGILLSFDVTVNPQ